MMHMNDELRQLRIKMKMTQEELAERLDVSRQTVAKWENGESTPDITKCTQLADVLDVEIDDVASMFLPKNMGSFRKNRGKYIFGKCVINHNRIAIPDEAMNIFGMKEGDELLLVGDIKQGMALIPISHVEEFIAKLENTPILEVDKYE